MALNPRVDSEKEPQLMVGEQLFGVHANTQLTVEGGGGYPGVGAYFFSRKGDVYLTQQVGQTGAHFHHGCVLHIHTSCLSPQGVLHGHASQTQSLRVTLR